MIKACKSDYVTTIFTDNFSRKTEFLQVFSLGEDVKMCLQGVTRVLNNTVFHNSWQTRYALVRDSAGTLRHTHLCFSNISNLWFSLCSLCPLKYKCWKVLCSIRKSIAGLCPYKMPYPSNLRYSQIFFSLFG